MAKKVSKTVISLGDGIFPIAGTAWAGFVMVAVALVCSRRGNIER